MLNKFEGFSSQSIDFLCGVGLNNYKSWVDEHKDEYKKYLFEPMKCLSKEIEQYINDLNKDIQCISTISRLNRDIRFSKNKNPYKDKIWFILKPDCEVWQKRPVYFFELKSTGYTYGMGYYSIEASTMLEFRKSIDNNLKSISNVIDIFSKQSIFKLESDKYKKKFNVEYSDKIMNWYTRKSISLICNCDIEKIIFTDKLVEKLKKDFELINDIYRYMWSLHK